MAYCEGRPGHEEFAKNDPTTTTANVGDGPTLTAGIGVRRTLRSYGDLVTVQATTPRPDDGRVTTEIPPGCARAHPLQEHADG